LLCVTGWPRVSWSKRRSGTCELWSDLFWK